MAGSYRHCEADDGSFRFDLIENMGDAHEACEQMYFMVRWLAGHCPVARHPEGWLALAEAAYFDTKKGTP